MTRRTGRDFLFARAKRKCRSARDPQQSMFCKQRAIEWLENRDMLSATPTSIAVSASSSSVVYGQPVTLTATVSGPLSAPSAGSVVFFNNGTPLATAPVSLGIATLENVRLPVGADLITASYIDPSGAFASSSTAVGPQSTIETVAGGGLQSGLPALDASISPHAVAVDSSGDLFIADHTLNVVFEVNHATGVATIVAGNGTLGFSGDGGQATAAELFWPGGIAIDSSDDLLIADTYNGRIRKVDHATGVITTIAGNGTAGFSGDGGPATAAKLFGPKSIAVDSSGDLFIADTWNNRIRKVNLATGIITTAAGNGTAGFSGDGGQATVAELGGPRGIAVDSSGRLFIADTGNHRVREVNHATGVITTVAGNGTSSFSGDGGPAIAAELSWIEGVAVDSSGDLFITDFSSHRIRKVDLATGVISTVAGNGTAGFSGDGGPATAAELSWIEGVAVDSSGDLFIVDTDNGRIRKVNHATGVITTVAGNATSGFSGDGGPATAAEVNSPQNIAFDSLGDLFIVDTVNNRIREVNHATGVITTVAGGGTAGLGDGGPATAAKLRYIEGIVVDSSGDLFIADRGNNRIRKVDHATGVITTVAGNGTYGFSGDGGSATAAAVYPLSIAVDSSGDLFIADGANNRIRVVNHATGIITTVAGNGTAGFSGDGGPATVAELNGPVGISVDSSGHLFIADRNNYRIREVDLATGVITTVAGNGTTGFSGEGGPATATGIEYPTGVAVDSSGHLFIANSYYLDFHIREVDLATGIITTVAGNGTVGFSGDGGPASAANIGFAQGVAVDSSGNLFIADGSNNRIREVSKGAVVNVTVPLVVNNAVYTIGSGVVSVSAADGLLKNDTGPTQRTVTSGTVTGAEGGTFVFNSDGSFSYAPPANFPGFDYAQFTVTDAQGDKASATVNVLTQAGGVVWKFYEQVLHREPDYGGLQHWINDFIHGGQTGDIAASFFESDELLNEIITGYYQQYLLRTPDAGGLAYWKQVWHANGGPETIKAGFADSPEFYMSAGVTPQAWVAELYHRVLGRDPDPQGEQFWLNYLTSHGNTAATRYQIALGFLTSLEAYQGDVTGWFEEFFERAPTASELNQYAGEMQAGKTDRDIQQEIANLPEYGQNPPAAPSGAGVRLPNYFPR